MYRFRINQDCLNGACLHWEAESHLKLVARSTAATVERRQFKPYLSTRGFRKHGIYPRLDILKDRKVSGFVDYTFAVFNNIIEKFTRV